LEYFIPNNNIPFFIYIYKFFLLVNNVYYIFIEEQNKKSVVKLVKESDWKISTFIGKSIDDLEKYSETYNINHIMKDIINRYDYAEEISFDDIDDYMN